VSWAALVAAQLVVMYPVVEDGSSHFGITSQPEKAKVPNPDVQLSDGPLPVER